VTNTGDRAGDEVVLLYVNDQFSSVVTPIKELKAFRRVSLKPGETKTVTLTLGPAALSLINAELKRVMEPGKLDMQSFDGTIRIFPTMPDAWKDADFTDLRPLISAAAVTISRSRSFCPPEIPVPGKPR